MLQQDIDFFKGNDRLFLFFMNLIFPVAPAELEDGGAPLPLSDHIPNFFSASSWDKSFVPLWSHFLFLFFGGLFPFCAQQTYASVFCFYSFPSLFQAFENNFGWRLLQETQSLKLKTTRKTNKKVLRFKPQGSDSFKTWKQHRKLQPSALKFSSVPSNWKKRF